MSDDNILFPKGTLVQTKAGGPIMNVFYVKNPNDGMPMPASLKNNAMDGDLRGCFWYDKSDQPCLTEIPVECLKEADAPFDPNHM